ncbi:MAG: hypothetical protein ACF8XB_20765 [Planctomycetota bacterium JB042]
MLAVEVNDHGETLVEVDVDPGTPVSSVVLKNGVVHLQKGQSLPSPPGAIFHGVGSLNLSNLGQIGWNLALADTLLVHWALYLDSTLLFQEGDPALASGLTPGSPYLAFFSTRTNDAGDFALRAWVDDANIGDAKDDAMIRVDAAGQQTLLGVEGGAPPGFPGLAIQGIPYDRRAYDIDGQGNVLWQCDTTALSHKDHMLYLNHGLRVREGDPSPVPGRHWDWDFNLPECALNDSGDLVLSGALDGDGATDQVIVRNGDVFVQEGDSLPAFAGFKLSYYGSSPVEISDRHAPDGEGDILWYAEWDDPNTLVDTGLFLDEKPLLLEGVDAIGGVTIDAIGAAADPSAMSDDGRSIVAVVDLVGGVSTAVLLELGPWRGLGKPLAGTTSPKLRGFGPLSGNQPVTLRLSRGKPGGVAHLVLGFSRVDAPFEGGTLVPSPDLVLFGLPIDADGFLELTTLWPATVPAGTKLHLQAWIPDAGGPGGYAASNALVGTSQ